ncbi:MAG: OB-fold domain-containing protein [Dehalococcoidia bacterium]
MVYLRSFGAYIPRYRLTKETTGWGLPVERAVANFDEDSVTMAVAAGMDCLRGFQRKEVDGLLFASTTPPYVEKQSASIIATALDLRRDIFTADVTGVLRAGTTALKMALDAINAGSAQNVLMVAADMRLAAPRGDAERNLGDGAAALLVSRERGVTSIEGSYHLSEHMLDVWRAQGDAFLRSWEDRFVIEEGFQRVVPEAVGGFMQRYSLTPKDFTKVALYAPDGRRHADMGRRLGFAPEQLQDHLIGTVGNTGAAYPLMLLVAALGESRVGDRLLVVSYGDGGDVFSFRVSRGIGKLRDHRGVQPYVRSRATLPSYETYARWRETWTSEGTARRPPPQVPSVSALWRETDQNIRLHGVKCNQCGYVQYPIQRVCTECQSRDDFTQIRLSDKPGTVFTYSMDYLAGTVDVPLVVTVVNFDGGGRMLCMMTDRELDEVKVDMPVQMSFRKVQTVGGIHNYYWKSVPLRVPNS